MALAFTACQNTNNQSSEESLDSDSTATEETAEVELGYTIGDYATDFKLMGTADTAVSMADYVDSKGIILTFTCNHCPYAKAYEDRLIALHNKYAPLGYPVVAVNPNDPAIVPEDDMDHMKERAQKKGFPFAYVLDEQQAIYPLYGATKTPHMYVLERTPDGLQVKYIGAIDNNYKDAEGVTEKYVEDAVDALLNGMEIDKKTTKAIGCSIKAEKA
jgi:peroxiredoxin